MMRFRSQYLFWIRFLSVLKSQVPVKYYNSVAIIDSVVWLSEGAADLGVNNNYRT